MLAQRLMRTLLLTAALLSSIVLIARADGLSSNTDAPNSRELNHRFPAMGQYGDALSVSAIETPKAINSVILGAAYAGERMLAVGERGHILYSDDQGNTWRQAGVPVRTTLTSVFFLTPQKGWAVGHDTVILTTEDGGVTWTKVLDGNQANLIVSRAAEQRMARIQTQLSTATGAAKSVLRDQADFAEMAKDEADRDLDIGPNKALMDIWFADENIGLAVGASGYVLRTADGGETWQDGSQALGSLDFFHLYKLVSNNNGYLFLLGEAGQVYRSQDAGLNWQRLPVPYEGSFFGGLAKPGDAGVYIFGMSGVVLKSLDNGDSWSRLNTGTRTILQNATVISGDRVAIVGLGGGLIVENPETGDFNIKDTGTRSAYTAVLAGAEQQLVVMGEFGIGLHDLSVDAADTNRQVKNSVRFMFSKRDELPSKKKLLRNNHAH